MMSRSKFGKNLPGLRSICAFSLAGVMATMSLQGAGAQATDIEPVVGVHSGTCADYVTEPAYDFGIMQQIPVEGLFEEGDGPAESVDEEDDVLGDDVGFATDDDYVGYFGDDDEFADDDEGFLSDDLDGDGTMEVGFDADADGVLADDEVLGEDVNDDGLLDFDEVWSPFPVGMVWKADVDDLEADGTELVNEGPYVFVVHSSEAEYDEVLACGPILDLVEEDTVVVPLQPFDNSGYFGTALIEKDSGEYAAYLFSGIAATSGDDSTP